MVHFNKVLFDVAVGPQVTESGTVFIIIGLVAIAAAVAAILIIRSVRRKKRNEEGKEAE